MNTEQGRFDFLVARDGLESARAWMRDMVKTYRTAWADPKRYGMYKRRLVIAYRDCKRFAHVEDAE